MATALSYEFSISLNQITKTEKWSTKGDNHVIYQRKLNNVSFCHIICSLNDYCHEILNDISDEISKNFSSIESKLEIIKNTDNS